MVVVFVAHTWMALISIYVYSIMESSRGLFSDRKDAMHYSFSTSYGKYSEIIKCFP